MGLTVLSVAYPFAPVGPDSVGGAEQILASIDMALTKAGHRSIVVAVKGSEVAGTLVAVPPWDGRLTESVRAQGQQHHRQTIERVLREAPVDLIHMHGLDFDRYLPGGNAPVLATLHLPPSWYPDEVFNLTRPRTYLHCVSSAQRKSCSPSPLLLPTIPNGVDVDRLDAKITKRNYAVAMGRICPEKGFHIAIDAARKAEIELVLAGQVFGYETHERYFADEIAPRLNGRTRFIGPVSFADKKRLLHKARCLLVPSMAPETSSLVSMEALACGTPVIAFPSGALADIVEHGRTGFLVHDEAEMAKALLAVRDLNPEDCRSAARNRFSLGQMIDGYFDTYARLLNDSRPLDVQWTA